MRIWRAYHSALREEKRTGFGSLGTVFVLSVRVVRGSCWYESSAGLVAASRPCLVGASRPRVLLVRGSAVSCWCESSTAQVLENCVFAAEGGRVEGVAYEEKLSYFCCGAAVAGTQWRPSPAMGEQGRCARDGEAARRMQPQSLSKTNKILNT